MTSNDDEQFDRDIARAIELSKRTAEEENVLRRRYCLPLVEPEDLPNSTSVTATKPQRPPVPPQKSIVSQNPAVRPRPKPSTHRRHLSPSSLAERRSGFVISAEIDDLLISPRQTPASSPTYSQDSVMDPRSDLLIPDFDFNCVTQDNTTRFPSSSSTSSVSNTNPFFDDISKMAAQKLSTSNPDILNASYSRPRVESKSSLIDFSPLNKEKINKHYNLDLDSMFSTPLTPNNSRTPDNSQANNTRMATSLKLPDKPPALPPRPSSTTLPPSTKRESTGTPPAISTRDVIKTTRVPFDVNDFFTSSPQTNARSSSPLTVANPFGVMSSSAPTTMSTVLPSRPIQPKPVTIKRVSTPTSNLVDLGNNLTLPNVDLNIFDPLFTPKDDQVRRSFEEQVSSLANRPVFVMEEVTEDVGDRDTGLQDPFSFEELNMALMTSSKIKGQDIEKEIEQEYDNIYETVGSPIRFPDPGLKSYEDQHPPSSAKTLKVTSTVMMDEFTSFSVMVARLKSEYKYDDKYTNLGILFSPTIKVPKPVGKTVEVIVYSDLVKEPIRFNTDVNSTVELVIWTVMANFSTDIFEVSADNYILKVFGFSEFLINDSLLSDYAYLHNCLKFNEPIRFTFHEVASLSKPFLRNPGDDQEPIYMIKAELHGDKSHKVNTKDVKMLYDLFVSQSEKVNQIAVENMRHGYKKGLTKLNVTALLQSVKAITSVLLGDETLEIQTAIKKLKDSILQIDSTIYDNKKFVELMDDFQRSMDDLHTGVRQLINMYCATFRVTLSLPSDDRTERSVKDATESLENILVHVGSIHRIPANIRAKFNQFKVIVSMYYAGKSIFDHVATKVHTSNESRSNPTIYFDEWIELNQTSPLCALPLEARIMFTLCAMNTTITETASNNPLNSWVTIGWVSFMLFDFRRYVSQGAKLLSLWSDHPNPTGSTGSNIWQPNTILLQVKLPDFGYDLRFPNIVEAPKRPGYHKEQEVPTDVLSHLHEILAKEDSALTDEDTEFLWLRRKEISSFPAALSKVLLSAPIYNFSGISNIQEVLNSWKPLSGLEALRLLLPDYPCTQIRNFAVKCLKNISTDEMCDFLPQLVQAIKYENYHDSALAQLLLERSLTSVRLAQQLYWHLKDAAVQPAHRERYKILYGGLVSVMGKLLREEMEREELFVRSCNALAESVKGARADSKDKVLSRDIIQISDQLKKASMRSPTNPGQEVNSLDLKLCTYFNSFTLPLKLVFKNLDYGASNHYMMYKVGDDLRQDMIVMQLIGIMDKIWLQNDLDLKIVTFTCLPTGDKKGIVELINECETLRKIQQSGGIAGAFKDQPLANWLQKHNPSHQEYNRAVENFTLSCAGYCVATYILGVGDRHNDNIMVKRTGHIFHIDFSKYLGDSQMFGNFKRDRTPFVLTPDMAYVINGGEKPSLKFQDFIDLCCDAFNVLRDNADSITTLFKMMTRSGIKGLTKDAVKYVRNALLPDQSTAEATASFTRMIEESLQSKFVQVNFFLHNLAQLKFSSHSDGGLLSFITTTYSMATDGRIVNVEIFDYQKRYAPEKHYIYIIKVYREHKREPSFVYRRYSEFQEFYSKLVSLFPLANIPNLPGSFVLGRTHVQKVAERRKAELETFLRDLLRQSREISEHDIIYTFFHPMLRDEEENTTSVPNGLKDKMDRVDFSAKDVTGSIKLSIKYGLHSLAIMVMHVKDLGVENADRPNPYVKLYLLPDPIKSTKRKTKISRANLHPTFNEMFEYRLPLEEIKQRTLQVTVWNAQLTGNWFLGAVYLSLFDLDLTTETVEWFKLSALPSVTV